MLQKIKFVCFLLIASVVLTVCGEASDNSTDNNNEDVMTNAGNGELDPDRPLVPEQERSHIELDHEGEYDLRPEGEIKTLVPAEFHEKLKAGNVHIVDLRSEENYQRSHIPGAENKDFTSISFFRQIDALDKDKPVLVYCEDGRLSHEAASLISVEGFPTVFILKDGFRGWQQNNLPVE